MKAVAVFLVLLFILAITTASSVSADSAESWMTGLPTVRKISNVTPYFPECTGEVVSKGSLTACLFGKGVKIGYSHNATSYQGIVSFPFDTHLHSLKGVCEGGPCQYDASRDILVTHQYVSSSGLGTTIFQHVSKRIHQIGAKSDTSQYEFDTTHPDYEVTDVLGQYVWAPTFAASNDGKWSIVNLNGIGLVLIDMDSLESRVILSVNYLYSFGTISSDQLTVSNDGKYVVLTGSSMGVMIIGVDQVCGWKEVEYHADSRDCSTNVLNTSALFGNFNFPNYPHFSDDGQQVSLMLQGSVGETVRAVLTEPGTNAAHSLKLLAMGDSFTSGEGETDINHYLPGTNDGLNNCHVSSRSYPFLVAMRIGVPPDEVRSVACAGAKVGDVIGDMNSYWGQEDRLGEKGLGLSASSKMNTQKGAVENFQPGKALQSAFLQRYDPDMVTIGIGGNDAGLMGKLSACAMPGTCEWATGEGLKATAGEIKRLFDILTTLFSYISRNFPDTKAYVVGYPDVIEANGMCDPLTGILLDYTERTFIEHSLQYLNQVVHVAAQKAGFTFLDIEQSMKGKNLCSGIVSEAMNGLRFGGDISVMSQLPLLKIISAGTFHPTPVGHALERDTILSSHPDLRQDPTCATDPMACTAPLITTESSSYWGMSSDSERQSYLQEFAELVRGTTRQLAIKLPGGSFEPNSAVRVEVHSDPIVLATLTADGEGGVNGDVSIPSDLQAGFHTLHLLGNNEAGDSIDVYQFLTVDQKSEIIGVNDGDMGLISSTTQDVLGVTDTALHTPTAQASAKKLIPEVGHSTKKTVIVALIGVSAVITTLVVTMIILGRRWAKPAS